MPLFYECMSLTPDVSDPQVPPLITKSDIDPEHCRVSAQLDDNVSQHQIKLVQIALTQWLVAFSADK